MGRIIAGDIGNYQYQRAAGGRQSAAMNGGKMFAHRIDFLDRCAATQQFAGDVLQIMQRNSLHWQRQQAGTAATQQAQQKIVRAELLHLRKNVTRSLLALRIWQQMPRLDHCDSAGRQSVAVAGGYNAAQRRFFGLMFFHPATATALPAAHYQRAATG